MYAVSRCQLIDEPNLSNGLALHVHFSPEGLCPLLALPANPLPKVVMAVLCFRVADEESENVMQVCVVKLDGDEAAVWMSVYCH